jgi:hypothetical protein
MRRCLILLLALPLTGCFADQQLQLGRCMVDAESKYPNATWWVGGERQNYVWLCMAANGYELNRWQKSCRALISPTPDTVLYPQCYQPVGKFVSLLYKLEVALER